MFVGGYICPRCKTKTHYSLEPYGNERVCVKCVLVFKVQNNPFRFSDVMVE